MESGNISGCETYIIMKEESVLALVEEAKEDAEAFGKLYDMYKPRIHGYIARRVTNMRDAEDLVAQTFEKVLRGIRCYDSSKASFLTWLYRIANHTIIDYMRRNGRAKQVSLDEAMEMYRFKSKSELQLTRYYLMVMELITELSAAHQEVLTLKFFEDKSNREIAEITGCSNKHIAVKVYRALRALRKLVEVKGILGDLRERMSIDYES